MDIETKNKVLEIADDNGLDAKEYEGSYSGRGMYGKTTEAIVVNRYSLDDLTTALKADDINPRVDNLGLSYILY